MGNRSRYHRPNRDRDDQRGYQRGYRDGVHEGGDLAVHLVLADLPGSGVTEDADGNFDCAEDVGCHGCTLERHGFNRLAADWKDAGPCGRHA